MNRFSIVRKGAVILLLAILAFTSSCSRDGGAATGEPERVITLLAFLEPGGPSPREQGAGALLETFTRNTGYTVRAEIVGWEQVEPRLLLSVQADNPPDVTFVRSQSISIKANANALMPLTYFIERDFTQADKDDFVLWDYIGVYRGVRYTLPMSIIPYAMLVRTDLFREAGLTELPRTWDEFLAAAQAAQTRAAFGFMFWGSAAQPAAIDYLQPFIEGFGGRILDENDRAVFDSPEAMQAFHLLKRMVFEYEIVPREVASLRYDETSDMFAAGRSVFYIDGAHRFSRYAAGVGFENLELFRIPGPTADRPSPSFVSFWSLGIPINSRNPELAWQYIKNFTTPENQVIFSQISGEVPVRISSMQDPHFANDPRGRMIKWHVDYVADYGTVAVAPVHFNQLSEVLSLAVQEIVSDPNSDVEAIVRRAAATYNAIVDRR